MIFTILAFTVAILVFALIAKVIIFNTWCREWPDWFFGITLGLIFGFMVFIGVAFLGFIPHYIWGETTIVDHKLDIVAVHNQTGIQGNAGGFLVFSCRIKDVDYFTFYYEIGENSYEKTKIPTDNTTIHEIDTIDENPRVEWTETETYSKIWIGDHTSTKIEGKHHLYVPKGSIQREFILK